MRWMPKSNRLNASDPLAHISCFFSELIAETTDGVELVVFLGAIIKASRPILSKMYITHNGELGTT
jgi:hypothetical protein